MGKIRFRGLFFVALTLGLIIAARLFFKASSMVPASLSARDEFGRNLYASTLDSLLTSYLEAGLNAFIAVSIPLLVAGFAAARKSRALRWGTYGVARILDAVPLFLWVALIFSAMSLQGFWGRQIAIALVAFPFTLGLVLERLTEIAELPFVQNARACGVRLPVRMFRLIVPNGISAVYFPMVTVFGLSLTFDAVLGLLGMASRSSLSLGTLLWRAKERAFIDPSLSILAVSALVVTMALFAGLRWALTGNDDPLWKSLDPPHRIPA